MTEDSFEGNLQGPLNPRQAKRRCPDIHCWLEWIFHGKAKGSAWLPKGRPSISGTFWKVVAIKADRNTDRDEIEIHAVELQKVKQQSPQIVVDRHPIVRKLTFTMLQE